ncbi:TrkA C-terminal domain-containing protein [Halorussus gelatinilyticus]|uniref:TrkA C-terminal domain-containing protein n=1 Tax=Halorussus gelatinilyticus TaxID=2937524 RepID=A0A8U0IME3_9EURY|nr:TrkA C-terminal domain-containing protein [Halorussus gelatinilyticus]UPW01179.1 TrkA C-terminal domain-containing protein [Halorussus gelatinilyticus]
MSLLAAVERPAVALARVVGLALLAGGVATGAGVLYRSVAHAEIPEGLAVLVGLGVVGGWLNTTTALRQFLGTGETVPPPDVVAINVAAFALGGAAAAVGARSGARVVADAFSLAGGREFEGDVSRLVQSVGRFVTVELPEEIGDIDGYEPLDEETAESLTGASLRFPRGLTVAELRERLVERLRDDYGVGHVDVELADDGTVEYLAAGGRAVGLGPTLAPGTVAVAVRADPAFSASAGDLVQVWRRGESASETDADSPADDADSPADDANALPSGASSPDDAGPERVATAELRATVGDVATLALDADAAADLDAEAAYRLVTLPTEPSADREFSARLRAADETVGAVTLSAASPLVGAPVGSLDATVVAVRDPNGIETIPADDRLLAPDDTLYVVARPDLLRKVEAAAGGAAADEETAGMRSDWRRQ